MAESEVDCKPEEEAPTPKPDVVRKVAFVHPDLGLGGAERLVVNSATGLQSLGHEVVIYTAFHDPQRSFKATHDGTLEVRVFGDFLPRAFCGYFNVLGAILRNFWTCLRLVLSREEYDVIFVDQISHNIPLLRWAAGEPRILFYIHFPDQLLTDRKTAAKKLYRYFIDWAEEHTTSLADGLLCNSKFTRGKLKKTFKSLKRDVGVLYPAVEIPETPPKPIIKPRHMPGRPPQVPVFFSLNRYEKKKRHDLAIKAYKMLLDRGERAMLIIAGGYDDRVEENKKTYLELINLCQELGLEFAEAIGPKLQKKPHKVRLWRNIPQLAKFDIYECSRALLYTPENEHFGIVPIEAMLHARPVIANNSGGPKETVINGRTGFLREATPKSWCDAMMLLMKNYDMASKLGKAGYERVKEHYSNAAFAKSLEAEVNALCSKPYNPQGRTLSALVLFSAIFFVFVCAKLPGLIAAQV